MPLNTNTRICDLPPQISTGSVAMIGTWTDLPKRGTVDLELGEVGVRTDKHCNRQNFHVHAVLLATEVEQTLFVFMNKKLLSSERLSAACGSLSSSLGKF